KAWILAKLAKTVAKIHEKTLHRRPLPDCAAVSFHQGYIPKFAASGGGGFFSGHAAGNEFLDLFFEVFVNLFGKIVVEAATRKQLFEPIHHSPGAKRYTPFEHWLKIFTPTKEARKSLILQG